MPGGYPPFRCKNPLGPAPRANLLDVTGELPHFRCNDSQLAPTPNPHRVKRPRTRPYNSVTLGIASRPIRP